MEWYRRAAEQGHAGAQLNLGIMYKIGEGVPEDLAEAAKWLQKAADQGKEKAKKPLEQVLRQLEQAGIPLPSPEEAPAPEAGAKEEDEALSEKAMAARLLDTGLEEYRTAKYPDAFRTFQKSANLDNVAAWFNLGTMYDLGRGVSRNLKEAFRWYKKAAHEGFAHAQFNLGQMYYLGQGVDRDKAEGFRWFQEAARQGLAEAQAMVGAIYLDGTVTARDRDQGVWWLRQAAGQGLEAAEQALASLD